MKAILDASTIIAFFDELQDAAKLLLLRGLDCELLVPDYVYREEILREPSIGVLNKCIHDGSISILSPVDSTYVEDFQRQHPALDRGESEVILNALIFQSSGEKVLCVLDEGPGRRVAKKLEIHTKGTLGVIAMLRKADLIDEVERNRLLDKLEASTFRVDKKLLR
ncbi:MAG: hypothetical protein V3U09_01375 [Thermoplasmata archaeon]